MPASTSSSFLRLALVKGKGRTAGVQSRKEQPQPETEWGPPGESLSVFGAQLLNQFLQWSQLPPVDQVKFLARKSITRTKHTAERATRKHKAPGAASTHALGTSCINACWHKFPCRRYCSHLSHFSAEIQVFWANHVALLRLLSTMSHPQLQAVK